jgi:hypothetical protein
MLPAQPPPIQQRACPECHLMTPGWRKHCIHCGKPIASSPAKANGPQQRPKETLVTN